MAYYRHPQGMRQSNEHQWLERIISRAITVFMYAILGGCVSAVPPALEPAPARAPLPPAPEAALAYLTGAELRQVVSGMRFVRPQVGPPIIENLCEDGRYFRQGHRANTPGGYEILADRYCVHSSASLSYCARVYREGPSRVGLVILDQQNFAEVVEVAPNADCTSR